MSQNYIDITATIMLMVRLNFLNHQNPFPYVELSFYEWTFISKYSQKDLQFIPSWIWTFEWIAEPIKWMIKIIILFIYVLLKND